MSIESQIKRLEESLVKSVEEKKDTVEISMKDAVDLLFILPKLIDLVETIKER